MIPRISHENGCVTLLVDEKPYLILGGETHNSCASSLNFMEQAVWPTLRGLHLNTLALPIYWELTEPEEGHFDFTLLDGMLQQARRENLRLVLLWFGLWKNAESTYVPGWVKKDTARFFRASLGNSTSFLRSDCLISPCCEAAVQGDATAFAKMMAHLREVDSTESTVILVQVENEVGILGAPRDRCAAAQRQFQAPVPSHVALHFGASGNWEAAFGAAAAEAFSCYCFASAIETISSAGKKEYALPLYVNAWTVQHPGERAGSYPSGGPVAAWWDMWKLCAPTIAFYSPDIYLVDFAAECNQYLKDGNPLFVPEAHNTVDAAAFSLYVAGCHNALGFSPFGIDTIRSYAAPVSDLVTVQEALAHTRVRDNSKAADYLSAAYNLLDGLWELIVPRMGTAAVQSCLSMNQLRDGLEFTQFGMVVKYDKHNDNAPRGAVLVIEVSCNKFFIAGTSCAVAFLASQGCAEIVQVRECLVESKKNRAKKNSKWG